MLSRGYQVRNMTQITDLKYLREHLQATELTQDLGNVFWVSPVHELLSSTAALLVWLAPSIAWSLLWAWQYWSCKGAHQWWNMFLQCFSVIPFEASLVLGQYIAWQSFNTWTRDHLDPDGALILTAVEKHLHLRVCCWASASASSCSSACSWDCNRASTAISWNSACMHMSMSWQVSHDWWSPMLALADKSPAARACRKCNVNDSHDYLRIGGNLSQHLQRRSIIYTVT